MENELWFFLYNAIPAEQKTTLSFHADLMQTIHRKGLVSLFDLREIFKGTTPKKISASLSLLTKRGHLRRSGKRMAYRWSINQEKLHV